MFQILSLEELTFQREFARAFCYWMSLKLLSSFSKYQLSAQLF